MKRWLAAAIAVLCVAVCVSHPGRAETPSGQTCNRSKIYDASTNGATQIVAPGGAILVCGYSFFSAGTVNFGLVYGTGTNCATGQTNITPAYQFTAQTGMSDNSPFFRGMNAPPNNGLCVNASAGVAVQAVIYYFQEPS